MASGWYCPRPGGHEERVWLGGARQGLPFRRGVPRGAAAKCRRPAALRVEKGRPPSRRTRVCVCGAMRGIHPRVATAVGAQASE